MKGILTATIVASFFAVGSAHAADMARPVYKAPVAVAAPVSSWTGFYIGGNAGYSWSNSNAINSRSVAGDCDPLVGGCGVGFDPNFSELSALAATGNVGGKLDGFIGGGQLGYNWQVQNVVWGLEADIMWMNGKGSGAYFKSVTTAGAPANPIETDFAASRSLDWLGTARARAGFLATPNALVFVTGGLAYGGAKLNASYIQSCVGCVGTGGDASAAVSASDTLVGWTIGGGAEWLIAPNWTVKAEYLYYDLGDLSVTTTIPGRDAAGIRPFAESSPTASARFDGHIVRAGLNYKFN